MAEKKNNATSKTSKIDELKARVHEHDVTIETSAGKKTITSKEWYSILTDNDAIKTPPKFNRATAIAISSYAAAAEGEKLSRQYGTKRESHFGFTYRTNEDIYRIQEMFLLISTEILAISARFDIINLPKLVKALVGNDEAIVETESMEKLNWMFKNVQFICTDIIRDNGFDSIPKFYTVTAEKNGDTKNWLVTAEYISKVFGGDDIITITDDGMNIKFTPVALPVVAEIYYEDDEYCLVSFYDAIKNIVTDYFENKLS